MNLTDKQKQALAKGEPVEISVEETDCVLLSKSAYDKIMRLFDDDLTKEELDQLADEAARILAEHEAMDDSESDK